LERAPPPFPGRGAKADETGPLFPPFSFLERGPLLPAGDPDCVAVRVTAWRFLFPPVTGFVFPRTLLAATNRDLPVPSFFFFFRQRLTIYSLLFASGGRTLRLVALLPPSRREAPATDRQPKTLECSPPSPFFPPPLLKDRFSCLAAVFPVLLPPPQKKEEGSF